MFTRVKVEGGTIILSLGHVDTCMTSEAVIIGVGRAGMNAAEFLRKHVNIDTVGMDTDPHACHDCQLQRTILVKEASLVKYVDRGFKIDSEVALHELEKIEHVLEPYKRVYLVGALGGSTGTTLLPAVAKEAYDMRKTLIGNLIFPFKIEERRRKIAEFYIQEIEEFFTEINRYDNAEYAERFESSDLKRLTSLKKIFDEVNEDILREIQKDELAADTRRTDSAER